MTRPLLEGFWRRPWPSVSASPQIRRCDGDYANCHTSLRVLLGPLLLRNGHQHGCEFGGNKRDGSL